MRECIILRQGMVTPAITAGLLEDWDFLNSRTTGRGGGKV